MSDNSCDNDIYTNSDNSKDSYANDWYTYTTRAGADFSQYFKIEDYLDGNYVIKNDVLIQYVGEDEVVQIPSKIRIIGYEAFSNSTTVRKIVGTPQVETIADFAFFNSSIMEMSRNVQSVNTQNLKSR